MGRFSSNNSHFTFPWSVLPAPVGTGRGTRTRLNSQFIFQLTFCIFQFSDEYNLSNPFIDFPSSRSDTAYFPKTNTRMAVEVECEDMQMVS